MNKCMPCNQAFAPLSRQYVRGLTKRQGHPSENEILPRHCPLLLMLVSSDAHFFFVFQLGCVLCSAMDTLSRIMGAERVGGDTRMVKCGHGQYMRRLLGTDLCACKGMSIASMGRNRSLKWVALKSTHGDLR